MRVLQILVLMIGLAIFANAQERVTLLSGKVYDSNKALAPSTAITAKDSNGRVFKTISNYEGFYRLWLPLGKYTIEFHKYGFKRLLLTEFEDIERLGKTFDAKLEVGFCNDCEGSPDSDEVENVRKPDELDFSKPKEKFGILSGDVSDEFGAVLPDLIVRFINKSGEEFQTLTNEKGEFLVNLPYGTYIINSEFKNILKNKKRKIKISKFENRPERIILVKINKTN